MVVPGGRERYLVGYRCDAVLDGLGAGILEDDGALVVAVDGVRDGSAEPVLGAAQDRLIGHLGALQDADLRAAGVTGVQRRRDVRGRAGDLREDRLEQRRQEARVDDVEGVARVIRLGKVLHQREIDLAGSGPALSDRDRDDFVSRALEGVGIGQSRPLRGAVAPT